MTKEAFSNTHAVIRQMMNDTPISKPKRVVHLSHSNSLPPELGDTYKTIIAEMQSDSHVNFRKH